MNRLEIAVRLLPSVVSNYSSDNVEYYVGKALDYADALIKRERETRCKVCEGKQRVIGSKYGYPDLRDCQSCNGTGVDWGEK